MDKTVEGCQMRPDRRCYGSFVYLLLYGAIKRRVFLCVLPGEGRRNTGELRIHLSSPHWFRAANLVPGRNVTGAAALKSGITNSVCFRSARLLDYSQKLTIY